MRPSLTLRNGFAWWLPLLTAAAATLIAVLVSQSRIEAWDADVHLWARQGDAADFAALLLEPELQQQASSGMLMSADGPAELQDIAVALNDTLIRVTVTASREADAESLALSLAHAAVAESYGRFGDEVDLDVLGLVQPGARQISPRTERTAAWASAIGLAGGLALAWLLAVRTSVSQRSTMGRIGRVGLRPLAVLPGDPTSSLSASLETLTSEIERVGGIVALTPLGPTISADKPLGVVAQTLAARGRRVVWLDARRPGFERNLSAPPTWLIGLEWADVPRAELIRRSATAAARRADVIMLMTDHVHDADTRPVTNATSAANATILLIAPDCSDDALASARHTLRHAAQIGAVLTNGSEADLLEFERAQTDE